MTKSKVIELWIRRYQKEREDTGRYKKGTTMGGGGKEAVSSIKPV
jgi:hypothetical protein